MQSWHGPRGQVGVAAAHRGRRIGIILRIHAKAKANSDCCPRGQSHCVALCPGIVRVDKRSAGIKAEAEATGVVVMIVFVGIPACLRVIRPLLVLFVHWIFACTDANDSWLYVSPKGA